jgi:RNA polymerase sigma-70 factor (ECF subfamily)
MEISRTAADWLIAAAREGQTDSLGLLLQLHTNYLKILAATQLDAQLRSRVNPSDVVQETLCEAHSKFDQFRGCSGPEFLAWLRCILVNTLAQLVERHLWTAKRDIRREVSLQAIDQSSRRLEDILVDQRRSPASSVEFHEHVMLLADILAEMPEDYRDVIVFRNLEGLGFKDVAQRMGRSGGAVRMLWLRAMDELRGRLKVRGWV